MGTEKFRLVENPLQDGFQPIRLDETEQVTFFFVSVRRQHLFEKFGVVVPEPFGLRPEPVDAIVVELTEVNRSDWE